MFVQAGDGQADGPDQVFRAAVAAHGVLFLEGGKFLSPKTFRKGSGEQLRRGVSACDAPADFVQPWNASNPLLRCGLDTFLDFVRQQFHGVALTNHQEILKNPENV